jgi:hypothetical protein
MVLLAGRGVDQWAKQPHCSFRRGANTNEYVNFFVMVALASFSCPLQDVAHNTLLASSCTWAECLGGTMPPYRITNSATVHVQAVKTIVFV